MNKSIFKAVAVSAVAAFFCVGCGDKSDDGPDDGGNPVDGGGTKSYTITFNANGGTVSPTSAKTGDDGKLASLPEPTRDGYTFNGWYTAAEGGTEVTVNRVYPTNATIYAQWTETPTGTAYTVTFDANDGTVSLTSRRTGTEGKLSSLPEPTRCGYTFDGWYTASTGGTAVTESWTYTANTTIYARWTAEPVTPPSGNTFTDSRDCKTYNKIVIGRQTWMAENLNYDVPSNTTDVCYGNAAYNCAEFGRLYNWETAMTACPVGWHLPSSAEWTMLNDFIGGWKGALKSTSGWNNGNNGTDEYGFSALPGGFGSDGGFSDAGNDGYWWGYQGDGISMWTTSRAAVYPRADLCSVRCVAD